MPKLKGIARASGESYFDALKASGGTATLESYGRNIRWIRELSGKFTNTSDTTTANYIVSGFASFATTAATAKHTWELQMGAAVNNTSELVINGWGLDGRYMLEEQQLTAADSTNAVALSKNFVFFPHKYAIFALSGTINTNVLGLQETSGSSNFAQVTASTSTTQSDQMTYIAVPPGGVCRINKVSVKDGAGNGTLAIHSADPFAATTRYETILSGTAGNTTLTDILATTDAPLFVYGRDKGRLIKFYWTDGSASASQTVEWTVDMFAEWNNAWREVGTAIVGDYANERD